MWEFNARMTLARKDLLDHVMVKPESAVLRKLPEWKVADMKALAVLVKLLSPTYQCMVRECETALEAWEVLQTFFTKKNLHKRVQLRKQLHEFVMETGTSLMDHLLKFDELCLKLRAAGDSMDDDEKLVLLLGSLSSEYDDMVRIIDAHSNVTLLDAKEMLRREYDTLQKRDKKETAFKAHAQPNVNRRFQGNRGHHGRQNDKDRNQAFRRRNDNARFQGKCFTCGKHGHKSSQCHSVKQSRSGDEFVFSASSEKLESSATWLLDSGASRHMTDDERDFVEYENLTTPISITVANGQHLMAKGTGSVRFVLENSRTVMLKKVLHVPKLDKKLVSVPALTARGVLVQSKRNQAVLTSNGITVAVINRVGKLFAWNVKQDVVLEAYKAESTTKEDDESGPWHARLGHVSTSKLNQVMKACDGITKLSATEDGVCDGFSRGKMTNSPFRHTSGSTVKTSQPLKIVHTDLMGPMNPKSKGGALYVLTFIDDYSRFVYVYLLAAKSQAFEHFQDFRVMVETQTDRKIKCIRSDNGGEFTSYRFNKYCVNHGIIHQTSVPYTPQQNGFAERMNRALAEMARSMLSHMEVDRMWWGEAVMIAAHTLNRIPNTARPNKSPFEVMNGSKPDLSYFRVFGSTGYTRVADCKRTKWDNKANKCIFLGYSESSKAYRVWDVDREQLVVTRSVTLDERPPSRYKNIVVSENCVKITQKHDDRDENAVNVPILADSHDVEDMEVDGADDVDPSREDMVVDAYGEDNRSENLEIVPIEGERTDERTGEKIRELCTLSGGVDEKGHQRTHMLQDICDRSNAIVPREEQYNQEDRLEVYTGSSKRRLSDDSYPRLLESDNSGHGRGNLPLLTDGPVADNEDDADVVEPEAKRHCMDDYEISLSATVVPTTYNEAIQSSESKQWKAAILTEIQAHERNHTWDVVRRPSGVKVIGNKWVFGHNFDENGEIVRYKYEICDTTI
uniref:Polyprotein n=1 Tax=Peronospora matthiolae TaxID=2874970 RepID=A0AAV1T9V0_9STRA